MPFMHAGPALQRDNESFNKLRIVEWPSFGHPKLSVGVNVCMKGCFCLYVSPVMKQWDRKLFGSDLQTGSLDFFADL